VTGGLYAATLAGAVACGLGAGVLFAFSAFVLPALDRLDPGASVAAMQAINVRAVTPPFMVVLLGGGLVCLGLFVVALRAWDEPSSPWLAAGAALYLVGVIGLTAVRNVPLNDALAAADPGAADAGARWAAYAGPWSVANHVRAAAGAAACALLVVAMTVG
jgi:uncharacterized membrane protein